MAGPFEPPPRDGRPDFTPLSLSVEQSVARSAAELLRHSLRHYRCGLRAALRWPRGLGLLALHWPRPLGSPGQASSRNEIILPARVCFRCIKVAGALCTPHGAGVGRRA